MRIVLTALTTITSLACLTLVGCGGTRVASTPQPLPADGAMVTEGGAMSPFYGEVFHENRFYLFGTKHVYAAFLASKDLDPKYMHMHFGQGPEKKTLIVQAEAGSPMENRLIKQCRARYGVN